MLDFMNNNPGLVAILGVVIGWFLSALQENFSYLRQKRDELEKERRNRFLHKAELNYCEPYGVDGKTIKTLEVVLSTYSAHLGNDGHVVFGFPRGVVSLRGLNKKVCYYENTGESDISDLEIGVLNPYSTALYQKDNIAEYVDNGYINYRAYFNGRIRKGEVLELVVYYSVKELAKVSLGPSLAAYYRDSRNNYCTQLLLPEERQTSEPIAATRNEWLEQVGTENNINYWVDRLKNG